MSIFFAPAKVVAQRSKQMRYMVWGGVGAGKTTLINSLQNVDTAPARKTQAVHYRGTAIDTPGEYTELGHLRNSLQATSADAQLLLVVQDPTRSDTRIPPNYFLLFTQPVIGVISKMDIATSKQAEQATRLLRKIGVVGEIFYVSAINGSGLDQLRQHLLTYI